MKRCRNQGSAQPENNKIDRAILLMLTLGGFGGGTSLCVAEAMIDPPSDGGTAQLFSSGQRARAIGSVPKESFS
jgi:hypothetical protein